MVCGLRREDSRCGRAAVEALLLPVLTCGCCGVIGASAREMRLEGGELGLALGYSCNKLFSCVRWGGGMRTSHGNADAWSEGQIQVPGCAGPFVTVLANVYVKDVQASKAISEPYCVNSSSCMRAKSLISPLRELFVTILANNRCERPSKHNSPSCAVAMAFLHEDPKL